MATENNSSRNPDTEPTVNDLSLRRAEKSMKAVNRTARNLESSIKRLRMEWARYDAVIQKSVASQTRWMQTQKSLVGGMRETTRGLRQQADGLRDVERLTVRTSTATDRLHTGLRRIAGVLGVSAVGALAVNEIRRLAQSRIDLLLQGGQGAVRAGGRDRFASDLLGGFLKQSSFARFGIGEGGSKGLMAMQDALKPLGLETANQLILDITKSLEARQLQSVLSTAAGGKVKRALMMAANGQNIGDVSSAINALGFSQDMQAGKPVDPLLKEASMVIQGMDKAVKEFDSAVMKFGSWFSQLSPGAQVGVGAAGVVGTLGAWEVGKYALKRAFGGGGGARVPGMPTGGIPGMRIPGMRPMLPAPALQTIPRAFSWGMPVTGGVAGVGLAGAAAAGSIYTAGRSAQTAYAERQALHAIEGSQQDRRLFDLASGNKGAAHTERARLVAQRQQIEAMLLSAPVSTGMKAGFFSPAIPETDNKQIEKLRAMRAEVQAQIKAIDDAGGGGKGGAGDGGLFSGVFAAMRSGAKRVGEYGKTFGDKLQDFIDKGLEANVRRLQAQAAKSEQLQLTASEKSAMTGLARAEFETASINPYGAAAARDQMNRYLVAIRDEIVALEATAANIDTSTYQGRIQQTGIKTEISQLRAEEKNLNRQWLEAMKGLAISEVLNASGPFKKIILDQSNLAMALQKGIYRNDLPEVTGSIGQSKGLSPRSFADVWNNSPGAAGAVVKALTGTSNKDNVAEQAKEIAKHDEHRARMSERLAELLAQTPEPVSPEMFRPTRPGGRTALGTGQ